jgi:sulfane dehydrogenase subunit SoxC
VFTVEEVKRLPSVTRVHFVECAGNSRSEWGPKTAPDAQQSHGLASCSEWTGALLSELLAEAGVQREATWILAEGADVCHMQRSIPLSKVMDDVLVAYGQNGEAIRPEQGYPLRLVVPGWEGNINVKWLRRLKVADQPYMTRDETSKYTDLMADGSARLFTYEMEAKSVITFPSGGQQLAAPGPYEISGLAWSGRGTITRVEVSLDGGQAWQDAQLQDPRHRMAFTRFRLPWQWDGTEATLVSRCADDSGYVQPTRDDLIAVRGTNSDYHNNCQKAWRVSSTGSVTNVDA